MSERTRVSKLRTKINTSNIKVIMTEKWQVVLLISLFWAGLFIGAFYINNADGSIPEQIRNAVSENVQARISYSGFESFKSSLFKYAVFLFAAWLFGLSGAGYPFVALVPILCGISNGIVSGYLYGTFGFSGFFYCLFNLYPGLIVFLVALIMGACESLELSINILRILMDKNKLSEENALKRYCYKYLILLGITIIASIIEAIFCHFFSAHFIF